MPNNNKGTVNMSLQVDLNDVAQHYKEQRNALADHNAILAAAHGAAMRKVEAQHEQIKALTEEVKALKEKQEAVQGDS